ncbi:MAG TPA: ergothioneine biosynthesis protein EgtB [Burkholderiales bacterium]|nr:ergothioneine biosynthesis protein EgtB [Burkholderiales bacterium]
MTFQAASELSREEWANRFAAVRGRTEALCESLEIDDFQVQSTIEVSPPKWHLAHVTWFFETFLLSEFAHNYRPFHPRFKYLFNSYYQTVGRFHPRPERSVLSRPTVAEIFGYREHVNREVSRLIRNLGEEPWPEFASCLELGLHHEQQHQELLLMDIKHNFAANPLRPVYHDAPAANHAASVPLDWIGYAGGVHEIGHDGDGFAFDNETPRHPVLLQDYRLASRPVTNGEFMEFVRCGGYSDSRYWLSDGWALIQQRGWQAPLYWERDNGGWLEMTLAGVRPLQPAEPVCHVSFYEADAYARWAGKRLPNEVELEVAAGAQPVDGNFVEAGLMHPRPAQDADDRQWYGDVWEWTSSSYGPYPGFHALAGSLGEYNGKFMCNQMVLRGGCCVTPQSHMRASYRNFFYPADRWPFTGIRLAADA